MAVACARRRPPCCCGVCSSMSAGVVDAPDAGDVRVVGHLSMRLSSMGVRLDGMRGASAGVYDGGTTARVAGGDRHSSAWLWSRASPLSRSAASPTGAVGSCSPGSRLV